MSSLDLYSIYGGVKVMSRRWMGMSLAKLGLCGSVEDEGIFGQHHSFKWVWKGRFILGSNRITL